MLWLLVSPIKLGEKWSVPPKTLAIMATVLEGQHFSYRSAMFQNADTGEHSKVFVTVIAMKKRTKVANRDHNPILQALPCIMRKIIAHTEAFMSKFAYGPTNPATK
jgi:hypothetical protein